MPTNDFLSWASGGSANIMGQSDYAGSSTRTNGVQAGTASSALANKTWRQGANVAAMLGEFIRLHGYDALDNGDVAALETNYEAALTAFTNALIAAGATSFATLAEVIAGTVTGKAVDPAKLAALMQGGNQTYAAGAGSANAITAVLTPAPVSIETGMVVRVLVTADNTGPATFNLAGFGAAPIVRPNGAPLAEHDLVAGRMVELVANGANWQLQSLSPTSNVGKTIVSFTATGSSTFTALVTGWHWVDVYGAGGGAALSLPTTAEGGGGCGYSGKWVYLVAGATVPVTVGTGGATATNSSSNGGAGGTSSFGSYCSATGGSPGTSGGGAGSGGKGIGGDINLTGSSGADGLATYAPAGYGGKGAGPLGAGGAMAGSAQVPGGGGGVIPNGSGAAWSAPGGRGAVYVTY